MTNATLLKLCSSAWLGWATTAALPPGATAVSPPAADETCFSPDEPCDAKLVRFVSDARRSLDVAIYDVTLPAFANALAAQAKKMPVRVVVDRRQAKGAHSLVGELQAAGVAVRFGRQRGIMHNKFIVRDSAMVETGSFNYTTHASTANSENQLFLSTPPVVERYRQRFAKLWREADPGVQM